MSEKDSEKKEQAGTDEEERGAPTAGGNNKQPQSPRRQKLKQGLQTVGRTVQRVNIAKWIDDLEHDQELADQLEFVNRETQLEQEHLSDCREAEAACWQQVESHLQAFLQKHPQATYEEWIQDLHPDNILEDNSLDPRFYATKSDHRRLWNDNLLPNGGDVARIHVPARKMTMDESKDSSETSSSSSSCQT